MLDTKYNFSVVQRIVAVLTGAILMGFLWRVRGDHGFGSFIGMTVVTLVFSLFVFSIFNKGNKMNLEVFPLIVFMTAMTNSGWGTINGQITGILQVDTLIDGEAVIKNVEINPLSGLAIMLFLGFGWAPFLGYFYGVFFSKEKYSIKNIISAVVVYGVLMYFAKASIAHLILNLINPEAVDAFSEGLVRNGLDANPWLGYLRNFNSEQWAKTVPNARNYFSSIDVIAQSIGTFGLYLFLKFKLKQRFVASIFIKTALAFAFSITLADLWIYWGRGGYLQKSIASPPAWLHSWSMWEYFTGFFAGLLIMLILFNASKKVDLCKDDLNQKLWFKDKKHLAFPYLWVFTFFYAFGVSFLLPLAERIVEMSSLSINQIYLIFFVPCGIIYFFIAAYFVSEKGKMKYANIIFSSFASKLFPFSLTYIVLVFFFTHHGYFIVGNLNVMTVIMLVSVALIYFGVLYLFTGQRNTKEGEANNVRD